LYITFYKCHKLFICQFFHESFPSFWVCAPWSQAYRPRSGHTAIIDAVEYPMAEPGAFLKVEWTPSLGGGGAAQWLAGGQPAAVWDPSPPLTDLSQWSMGRVPARSSINFSASLLATGGPPPKVTKKGPGGAPGRRPRPQGRPPAAPTQITRLSTTKSNFQSAFFLPRFFHVFCQRTE